LIEEIVGFAEQLTPIALTGAGGIGKTSIALTALHDDRIKQRFGDHRRFIRCDKFPTSLAHFLNRLSKVVGAGVENPEDLTPLQPFLSSREMVIVLDNAESILDPQGNDAEEIYAAVEELSQFSNIWLCITSRIATIPPDCETIEIPALSIEAAHETFYRIYKNDERSDLVSKILEQLDFHPLSITLLATVAHQNKWNVDRLAREWEIQRTRLLRTRHNKSLAATIELSLASPMFQELGPHARGLLGVVAFFPQGVDEKNLDWFFPTISNRRDIFDQFCILSLTYQSNGFITMLAPLRDNLCPERPNLSPLLCATKECYLRRLSSRVKPGSPGYEEARWIVSEDVNVEHLLNIFTSIDTNADNVWNSCACFMEHLYFHKSRLVVLGPKLEGLPDDHPSKPECLLHLSRLFNSVGNFVERKRLLVYTLALWRERGDDFQVATTLMSLASTNKQLLHFEEGILQAKEALEIHEQHHHTSEQANALEHLAWLLFYDKQFDAAEDAASRSINLLSGNSEPFMVCKGHRVLGNIRYAKGETEKAIDHFKTALEIADSFNWDSQQYSVLHSLAELFCHQNRFDDAYAHVERAKSHTVNGTHRRGRVMELQAHIWYKQGRLEEAKAEVLRAVDVFKKLGATKNVEKCREFLQRVEESANASSSGELDSDCEFLEMLPLPTPVNSPFLARKTE
jgi:tetratricopeptide (TPR) repeat protein